MSAVGALAGSPPSLLTAQGLSGWQGSLNLNTRDFATHGDATDMNAVSQTIPAVVESLIEACRNGQEGFLSAAEDVKNPAFKTLFGELAQQRREFAGELQAIAVGLGGEAHVTSTVAAAIHRGWMDIKAALASGNEHAVLSECERGEDAAVAEYREALDRPDLPAPIRQVVERQFQAIHGSHDRMRRLRDLLRT